MANVVIGTAILEAKQQEEYHEERAHVWLDDPMEEDQEENFVVHPTTDDSGV